MATESRLAQYLNDTSFPATREEIITMAEENGAPDDILEALSKLPEAVYDTIHEVWALLNAHQSPH